MGRGEAVKKGGSIHQSVGQVGRVDAKNAPGLCGPGVPDSHIANLFRPFYRVSDARERITGGTGLGLAITERALKIHHGNATARNASDGGLIVTIQLPLQ